MKPSTTDRIPKQAAKSKLSSNGNNTKDNVEKNTT